jgi:hypothetical protein
MSFTLYNAPQSTCSQRVRFVLNAKRISFAEIKLDLLAGDQLKPDYLALNPNGVVPTLDHDGEIVIDSSVIIEYLDEVVPTPESFTARDPVMRARMRALMRFIEEMPAAAVRVPTFNLAFLPRFAAMSEEEFLSFAESKPLRKEFMLTMGRKGFPQKEMCCDRRSGSHRRRRHRQSRPKWLRHSEGPLGTLRILEHECDARLLAARKTTGSECLLGAALALPRPYFTSSCRMWLPAITRRPWVRTSRADIPPLRFSPGAAHRLSAPGSPLAAISPISQIAVRCASRLVVTT